MRKYLFSFAVMMGTALLTGCLSDDDNKNNSSVDYVVTKGALIINNGNTASKIDGSLTFLDFGTSPVTVQQNVYKMANGVSLGGTPNDVYVYGNKIYITGSDENVVFVLNKSDFKQIKKISTIADMGEAEGVTPRHLKAYDGKVYVTTYGGYVGVIDTLSLNVTNMYKVGSAPEGMAFGGTSDSDVSLYVANSDYGNGNGSISKITLATGTITEIKNEKIHNPQQLAVSGNLIYVLDWGYYDENWNQKEAGVYLINGSTVSLVIPDATGMAASGQYIVTYNYPYGSSTISYSVYNAAYNMTASYLLSGGNPIASPCAISIDSNTGYVFLASRTMDPDTGYPSYTTPGYLNIYDGSGQFVSGTTYTTGVEPHAIAFTHGYETIHY